MTEPVRATLHRVFAVMMVITALSHMWDIFLTERGREEFKAMMPRLVDLKDFLANIRFHTWRSQREVKFGRYDYSQKAEYWALIWGTILMIITGFILWFPGEVVKLLPSWTVTASQTIHYYEAWLATLAIIVWHFFFVIFHPEEYPMSWTWLTGKMSERAVKKHHARWYEEEIAAPSERREQRADTEIW
jgi:cytochrome b subunit of formate dehydrogenase